MPWWVLLIVVPITFSVGALFGAIWCAGRDIGWNDD